MKHNQYGDSNIPNTELAPLSKQYMSIFGININLQRAIPQVQDGLKLVQRRIMYQLYKNYRNVPKVRVSVLMGDVMKLHPHSDMGLGDTIARMCQPFANNVPLINSLGNSGNVTAGDDAAASRYLDVFLPQFSKEVLFDEFDGKIGMRPSYDGSTVEPFCLPAKFPLILLNGSAGIGYTLSSDIPPYNLSEVADATVKLLKDPEAKIKLVPDSPTGCDMIIMDKNTFVMQSSYDIDSVNYVITIKNTPYMKFLEKLDADLSAIQVGPNPIHEILSAEDESDLLNNDFKYVIRCKPCNLYKVLDTLFKRVNGFRSSLSTKNMVVVDTDFMTKELDTRQILLSWIKYRMEYKRGWFLRELVEKTTEYNMLSGKLFLLSPENIEKTIKIFKSCKNREAIIPSLVKGYDGKITTSQASYVSELKMYQLNANEYDKTKKAIKDLSKEISYIRDVVNDSNKIRDVIIDEIKTIKNKYGTPRKSKIINLDNKNNVNIGIVQILTDGTIVFAETENPEHLSSDITPVSGNDVTLIDENGYFITVDTGKVPHNQPLTLTSIGKNIMGNCVAAVSNKSNNIVMLTNMGRIKYMPINRIPSNASRKPLIPLNDDEHIVSILEVQNENSDILIYTNDGLGKRIQTSDLNLVSSVDAMGQFILWTNNVSGMFIINPKKPLLLYVTRLGRIRLNHSKFLTTTKKFGEPKPIIKLTERDDLIAVFCVTQGQSVSLTHIDGQVSTVDVDKLPISTMAIPPQRPKNVPGTKVIRATIS